MNVVERIRNTLAFQPVDRLPMLEWGPWWNETLDRWQGEGLPPNTPERRELLPVAGRGWANRLWAGGGIIDQLGLDSFRVLWLSPRHGLTCPVPQTHGGGLVEDEDGYRRLREHLFPEPAFDREQLRALGALQRRGETALWAYLEGFFWFPRTLFGIEPHLYAFYDQPELMHRMNADLAEYYQRVVGELCECCVPDVLLFAEDLSYNHGPMLSRENFQTFLTPYYHRLIPFLESRGIRPLMDSDGDVTAVIPWAKEAGIRGIGPLERIAGTDLVQIRRDHPEFLLAGGFDKLVMKHGEAAMRAEFERLLPVMRQGGFLPTADHQTPPEVSLDHYRTYLRLFREYGVLAARG